MLITKVKVGQVTNLSEARYCAGMGVDFLSFPIAQIDPKTFDEITAWVAGPQFGIEVTTENIDRIDQYSADFIQTDIHLIEKIPADQSLIVSASAKELSDSKLKSIKDRILFVELSIDELDSCSRPIIEAYAKDFNVLIKIPANINIEAILKLPIVGISLNGGAEERPGLKEYSLAEVLEKLEEA